MAKKNAKAFPLTLHRGSGQWCKKLKVLTTGKWRICYFGQDRQKALERYLAEKDGIQAGQVRGPSGATSGSSASLAMVLNAFLESKRRKVDSGDIGERQWREYYETAVRLRDHFGRDRLVETLTPTDFGVYRAVLAKKRGPVALANEIQRVRTMMKYAVTSKLITKPVDFGDEFNKPDAKRIQKARNESGSRMIEAEDIRRILAKCGPQLKAMVLLGINAGYGQTDCSSLPLSALDLVNGWVTFPRPKTHVPRRCPLWDETIAALKEAIACRPEAKDPADADAVFLTQRGVRWVRVKANDDPMKPAIVTDSIATEFTKRRRALGLTTSGSFYALRHTHRTVSDEANDRAASDYLMGHRDSSMAGRYIERPPSDARLRAVTDHIREWLFPQSGPHPQGTVQRS